MTKDDRQDATTCLNQRQSQEQGEWGRGAVEVTAAKKEKKKKHITISPRCHLLGDWVEWQHSEE